MAERSITANLRADISDLRSKMTEAARLTDKVGDAAARSSRRTSGAFASIGRSVRGADQSLGRLAGSMATLGGRGAASLAKVGAVGGAALLGVGAAGVAMGLKVAAGNEQARISFSTMLGSAEKADKFLRNLQKFAAQTPFEFPELQTAAASLISTGIEADKVIPIMRSLGDITSGMGTGAEGVKRATVALQQMNAAGRITAEDLNQLRDAGVPVFEVLAAATGKAKKELAGMAQEGKLGQRELDALMSALESGKGFERFSGLMDKQSASLSGMLSTLKDTFGQGLASAIEPAIPTIKAGLTAISTAAGNAFAWVADHRAEIASLAKSVGASLGTMARLAGAAFGGFFDSASGGKDAFTTFADSVATSQADITGAIVRLTTGALNFGVGFAEASVTGLRGLADLSDGVDFAIDGMIGHFGDLIRVAETSFGWIPGIGDKISTAKTKYDEFAADMLETSGRTGDGLRSVADGIEGKLVPALETARDRAAEMGRTEIVKANQRDAAAAIAIALRDMGGSAKLSKGQLRDFTVALAEIPAEKRAKVISEFKRNGVDAAMTALAKLKDRTVIARSRGDLKGAKQVDAAMKALKDRLVLARSRGDESGARRIRAAMAALRDRTVTATARGNPSGAIAVQRIMGSIQNKTVTVTVVRKGQPTYTSADGGYVDTDAIRNAGFAVRRSNGGPVWGAGTATSDSIPAMLSDGEFVQRTAAVDYYGESFMRALNSMQVPKDALPRFAAGGGPSTPVVYQQATRAPASPGLMLDPQVLAASFPDPAVLQAAVREGAREGIEKHLQALGPREMVGLVRQARTYGNSRGGGL